MEADPNRTILLCDLEENLDQIEEVKPPIPHKPARILNGDEKIRRATVYSEKWEAVGEGFRDTAAYRHAATLTHDFGISGDDAFIILSRWDDRNTPPLGEAHIRKVLDNGDKYGTHVRGEKLTATTKRRPARAMPDEPPDEDDIPVDVMMKPLCDIEDKPLMWFWYEKIPDHGLSMLQGDPGVSKSYLSLYMACHISTGTPWPDCPDVPVEQGSVLIISGEDDASRVKERCRWMDGDMSKILMVELSNKTQLDIRQHLDRLQVALDGLTTRCRLIIFDPITAYMGNCRANNNNEVRAALDPLADFAVENELCIITINHMNKKAGEKHVYRGLGSMGFTAVARSVWGVVFDDSDDDRETRILCPVKANYSKHPSGLKYQIIDNAIQFEAEPYYGNIDDVESKAKATKVDECVIWIRDRLKGGQVASRTFAEDAERAGFRKSTIQTARRIVGTEKEKSDAANGGWFIALKA